MPSNHNLDKWRNASPRPNAYPPPDLLPITYKCIQLQLELLYNFMITDYNYNYIFPECNQLQLHCNVIDYNYNYFLVVPCLKNSSLN